MDAGLIDLGRQKVIEWPELLDELEELLGEEIKRLNCEKEFQHLRTIYQRGTSAHRQTKLFHGWIADGVSEEEAFRRLVDDLIQETARGL